MFASQCAKEKNHKQQHSSSVMKAVMKMA